MNTSWLHPHRDKVIELAQKGLRAVEIAAELGDSSQKNAVIGFLRRQGLKLSDLNGNRRAGHSVAKNRLDKCRAEIVDRIKRATDKGRTMAVLAARFGVGVSTLRLWLRERGLTPLHDPKAIVKKRTAVAMFTPPPIEGVPFLDAGPDQCRYPLWSIEERIGNVCGRPVVEKVVKGEVKRLSWCCECLQRVSARKAEAA